MVLAGTRAASSRILLWKFPADQSLRALMKKESIEIELIEDAFSRKSTYYKAAMFEGSSSDKSVWRGKVEDNQAKHSVSEAAEFWIADFLSARSEFTDVHGTRVTSKAIKRAIDRAGTLDEKEDLVAVARVLRGQSGQSFSLNEMANNYIPPSSREAFLDSAGPEEIKDQRFRLDART